MQFALSQTADCGAPSSDGTDYIALRVKGGWMDEELPPYTKTVGLEERNQATYSNAMPLTSSFGLFFMIMLKSRRQGGQWPTCRRIYLKDLLGWNSEEAHHTLPCLQDIQMNWSYNEKQTDDEEMIVLFFCPVWTNFIP